MNIMLKGDNTGKCHICKDTTTIRFCSLCNHWFCSDCRGKFFHRGLEAIKQVVGGKVEGCCGPKK